MLLMLLLIENTVLWSKKTFYHAFYLIAKEVNGSTPVSPNNPPSPEE